VQFTVTLRNGTDSTYRDITPLVSIGHCTCFSGEPVPVAPGGTLAELEPASGGWRPVYYDKEGTGMDYILGNIPGFPPVLARGDVSIPLRKPHGSLLLRWGEVPLQTVASGLWGG
jgi:hypothetical protein